MDLTHFLLLLFSFPGPGIRMPSISKHLLGAYGTRPFYRRDAASGANSRSLPLLHPYLDDSTSGVIKNKNHSGSKACHVFPRLIHLPEPKGTSSEWNKRCIAQGKMGDFRSRRQVTKNQDFFKNTQGPQVNNRSLLPGLDSPCVLHFFKWHDGYIHQHLLKVPTHLNLLTYGHSIIHKNMRQHIETVFCYFYVN